MKKDSKIVDMHEAGKARADREMKPILDELARQNAYGITTEQLLDMIDDTCKYIKIAALDYYMSVYESSEPGVAALNTNVLCSELKMVAQGAVVVPAKDGDKFLPISTDEIKILADILCSHPELSELRDVVQEIAAWL
jgi:hypothetical protein